jgi:hypothetical protein
MKGKRCHEGLIFSSNTRDKNMGGGGGGGVGWGSKEII